MENNTYIAIAVIILIVLLIAYYVYTNMNKVDMGVGVDGVKISYIDSTPYYVNLVNQTNLDIKKLAHGPYKEGPRRQWYYDRKPTCIAHGAYDQDVPAGLTGSSGKFDLIGNNGGSTYRKIVGGGLAQFQMIKYIISNNLWSCELKDHWVYNQNGVIVQL